MKKTYAKMVGRKNFLSNHCITLGLVTYRKGHFYNNVCVTGLFHVPALISRILMHFHGEHSFRWVGEQYSIQERPHIHVLSLVEIKI